MRAADIKVLAGMLGSKYAPSGDSIQMSCPNARFSPLHRGTDRRFSFGIKVSDTMSVCHCFTCQIGGSVLKVFRKLRDSGAVPSQVFDYVSDLERFDLVGFARRLAVRKHKIDVKPEEVVRKFNVHSFVHQCAADKRAVPFFRYRGLTEFEIEKYKLGYDKRRGRATIPICSKDGEYVGCVGRAMFQGQEPKYWKYPSINDRVLMGENFIDTSLQRVVLVEGPLDYIKACRCIPNVLALNGLTLSSEQRERLLHFADWVYLMFDGDAAGRNGIENIGTQLRRKVRVSVIMMPEGLDPADLTECELYKRYSASPVNFHY